jgi:hypothetical protein
MNFTNMDLRKIAWDIFGLIPQSGICRQAEYHESSELPPSLHRRTYPNRANGYPFHHPGYKNLSSKRKNRSVPHNSYPISDTFCGVETGNKTCLKTFTPFPYKCVVEKVVILQKQFSKCRVLILFTAHCSNRRFQVGIDVSNSFQNRTWNATSQRSIYAQTQTCYV